MNENPYRAPGAPCGEWFDEPAVCAGATDEPPPMWVILWFCALGAFPLGAILFAVVCAVFMLT